MRRVFSVLLCVLVIVFTGCRSGSRSASRTGFGLDTVVSVTINEATDAQAALDACFAELERLEGLLSATVADSDISRINAAGGTAVAVSAETAELLQIALQYAVLSDGAFDITMRPVTELWNFSSGVLPDTQALTAAVARVDYRRLSVSGTTVTLSGGGLEPGGIAKGYIADCLRELLEKHGVTSALIDLGGNIVVCGSNKGNDWRIGIKDPKQTEELCAVVTGRNLSVVTSGIYERGFTLDGVRYHHLLSPESGMPVQNGLASVTIVCESSVQADALSTACFVLGEVNARTLLASLPDAEALFVYQDGTITATEGLSYTLV